MHVLAADTDSGQPGKTLLTKEVILTDNASFITIDTGKDKINLETGVYFVAIEWLFIPFNEVISFSGSKN
ncbi:hypothetical protein HK413_12070 [Mucilaginibacter sp. S1162]|uniref:DUF4382 domain-containing protein n=1 Tax=Mucilaginibacter humi TaxID=2732510 RepID=A0ABX1W6H0_9SPHI|nr:hypothetical protein [Mucilaginibacter humi]NNU34625.1 hypothetical protein [Mucilaginibacter humi]